MRFTVFKTIGVGCLLGLLLHPLAVRAQASRFRSRTTDSLRAVLRSAVLPDSQRVLTLFSLEQEYYLNDDATALRIARQALAMARRQGFVRGELMLINDMACINRSMENLPEAERWAQELQRRAWAAPASLRRFRIVALQTLAQIAESQGNEDLALRYSRQSLGLLGLVANRPTSDFPLITYFNLSRLYTQRAVEAPGPPPDSLVRQARGYTTRLLALAQTYVSRFAYLQGGSDRRDMLASAYSSLGQLSQATGGDSAAYYLGRAARLYQALRYGTPASFNFALWAQAELRAGQPQAALRHATQALALARAAHAGREEAAARDALAEVLAATGQPAAAYQEARRARQLHDSVVRVNSLAQLQTLQVRFDTQRKESQIQALTRQRAAQQAQARRQQQQLWLLALGLAVAAAGAAAVGVLALRLRRSRAQLAAQNEELTQTRATQDRLYALVAHDLRSPVVAFSGLADLLSRYVQRQDTARLASMGGRIRQAAQNLSELLDNLLNWAVSQRGELVPAPRPLRVAELLAEISVLYENAAAAADVTLTVETDPDLLIEADPNMTRTILRNLTGNALKATPRGGRVALRARRQAGSVLLQVADTGQGLPPEALAELAGPARLHVANEGRGAGLGLLLSRNFAQAQGGTLTLANAEVGAVALLTLPSALG